MVRVPQTGFSYRSFTGLASQPIRRWRVNGRLFKIAEQRDAVELQIRPVAPRTRDVRNLDPKKGHLPDVGAHFPFQGNLIQTVGFLSTAADTPSPCKIVGVVLGFPECFSNALPKNRAAMIAAKIGMSSVSVQTVPKSGSRGSCYRMCPYPTTRSVFRSSRNSPSSKKKYTPRSGQPLFPVQSRRRRQPPILFRKSSRIS